MSELKSQIDYSKLEWFDCESNFPPMNINLYVDSEHGFGIGRLGKRVKDGSTIWRVHLDSGEVYLVYAFYKVKRWAYMEEEKTNTKLKHELMLNKDRSWVPCYLKSEADKVIAEKDKAIEELRNEADVYKAKYEQEYDIAVHNEKQLSAMRIEIRRQKYKRCLAMAERCSERFHHYVALSAFSPNKGAIPFYDKMLHKAYRWKYKWLELAEKFKEAK